MGIHTGAAKESRKGSAPAFLLNLRKPLFCGAPSKGGDSLPPLLLLLVTPPPLLLVMVLPPGGGTAAGTICVWSTSRYSAALVSSPPAPTCAVTVTTCAGQLYDIRQAAPLVTQDLNGCLGLPSLPGLLAFCQMMLSGSPCQQEAQA